MGLGDWIMATSQVREMNLRSRKRVVVVDRKNRPQWSEAFDHSPRIARAPTHDCEFLRNGPGIRPYIMAKSDLRWHWQKWPIAPGEIFLSKREHDFGKRFASCVVVEPNTKVLDGNKSWPFDRWQRLVSGINLNWLQIGKVDSRRLVGVQFHETSVREAFAILNYAKAFVGTEGALHHAAAAFGTPSVVLWSEFISPEYTGYANQLNIRKAGEACGSRVPCAGCRASMNAIEVSEVIDGLLSIGTRDDQLSKCVASGR